MAEKIVYKTVAVILALCVVPLAFFSPLIQIVGDISLGDARVGEHVSLYDIYDLFFSKDAMFDGFGDFKMTDEVRATMPALIASGVFLALVMLLGIAGACTAICCRKKLPTLLLAAAGFLCVVGLFVSFNHWFAVPYVDGTISVANLGFLEEGILETLFSALVHLEILQISSAGFLMGAACLGAVLWTGAYMLVELGEDKPQKKSRS